MKPITFPSLKKFNLIMGGMHLVQGVLMLFLLDGIIENIAEFQPGIIQFYLTYDPILQSLVLASKPLFDLPFGVLVSVFLFLSALFHFLVAFPFNKTYNADLEKGINKFRWFEYALSSSVMIVLIATLFGIYDLASLVLIFIVNAVMNLFGLMMEQLNSRRNEGEKVNWSPFVYGTIAGLAPWIAIVLYMAGNPNLDMVPWFVWAIVVTYFIAFNTFPVNMVLQYKKVGKWANYLYGEKTYIVLSLVAKTILAWLVFFGAMQP